MNINFLGYTPERDGVDFAQNLTHKPHVDSKFNEEVILRAASIMQTTRNLPRFSEELNECGQLIPVLDEDGQLVPVFVSFANCLNEICYEALHDIFVSVCDAKCMEITVAEVYRRRGYFSQSLDRIWFYLADICLNVYFDQLINMNCKARG